MSVEFRQRTASEYAQIIWKRKWLIIFPALAVSLAVTWVVLRLPNVYESSTLLTVRPSNITTGIVPQISDDDLTLRLTNIGQEVLSRSSLEPLIQRYDLYHAERMRGEPIDSLVDRMSKKDIVVEVNKGRNDITNGFHIAFRGSDPATTRAVAAELASKYVNAETEAASRGATSTKEFFEQQLRDAQAQLDAIDQKRLQYMSEHESSLPTQETSLGVRLTGLYENQKALIAEVGRLRDQQAIYNSQLSDLQKQREQEIANIAEQVGDPTATPAWAELVRRKAELEAKKQEQLTVLRPKNPDVIATTSQLDSIQREMDAMVSNRKAQVEERRRKLQSQIDPRINTTKYNQEFTNGELKRQQALLDQTNAQIADIDRRINSVPGTEVGLEALNRDYQTAKANYDSLLTKQQQAKIQSDVAATAQGETIQVIDPANLPERPVAPKRPLLMALGLALGLAVGFTFAVAYEVPRLLTIQTTEDAQHYTKLPVLISVPELLTPQEERRRRVAHALLAATGIAMTIASIPVIAYILKLSHVMDRFAA